MFLEDEAGEDVKMCMGGGKNAWNLILVMEGAAILILDFIYPERQ